MSELPPAWGWRQWDGKRWFTHREASATDATPVDRAFLAALLRRADVDRRHEIRAEVDRQVAACRDAIDDRVTQEVDARSRTYRALEADVKAFEDASGLDLRRRNWIGLPAGEIGQLVKVIQEAGLGKSYIGLASLATNLRQASARLDKAIADCALATLEKAA